MFHTLILSVLVPMQESEPAPGHSPISPVASGNFPGSELIRNLVNYALFAGYAACTVGFIYGASSIWLSNAGHVGAGAHQRGVKALVGSVIGGMLLGLVGAFF